MEYLSGSDYLFWARHRHWLSHGLFFSNKQTFFLQLFYCLTVLLVPLFAHNFVKNGAALTRSLLPPHLRPQGYDGLRAVGERISVFPCILLHGYGGEGSMWLPAVVDLVHRYRFVLPDLRGYGRSCLAAMDNNKSAMTQYVEDIDDLMDLLGIEEAKLGGASER